MIPYLAHLRNPNSIAFIRTLRGQDWFLLALTDRLVRYKFTRGEESPSSLGRAWRGIQLWPQLHKYGGWHLTRTIAFGPDHFVVRHGGK